jgi:hypothetical protein
LQRCKLSGEIDKHNSIVNAIYINMKKAKIACNVEGLGFNLKPRIP